MLHLDVNTWDFFISEAEYHSVSLCLFFNSILITICVLCVFNFFHKMILNTYYLLICKYKFKKTTNYLVLI